MNNPKYIQYFSRLYEITGEDEGETSPKYHKAFALLMKHYYEHGDHGRAGRIFESLPEKAHDYDTVLSYARAESRLGNFEKALKPMEKLYLKSDEDRYLLCLLYARTGRADRARQSLKGLSDRAAWYEKARREPSLRNIVKEIEEEQRKSVEAPR
jgi:tetratricopeptide (TPR) repeat protein